MLPFFQLICPSKLYHFKGSFFIIAIFAFLNFIERNVNRTEYGSNHITFWFCFSFKMLGAGMVQLLWPQAICKDLTMQGINQLCQFIISERMNIVLPKVLTKTALVLSFKFQLI